MASCRPNRLNTTVGIISPSLWETVKPELQMLPEIDLAQYLSPREVITDVINKRVSKLSGLGWLAGHYGISLEEIAIIW